MFLVLLIRAYKINSGLYPPLFVMASVLSLVIPPTSNDYKLSLVPVFMVIYFIYLETKMSLGKVTTWKYLIIGLISFFYIVLLTSYVYEPKLLSNSFLPLIMLSLLIIIIEIPFTRNELGKQENT